MKGKMVTMAVSFLLCVGMVGAGFASWVITNNASTNAEGTIAVDTVVDKRLKLEVVQDSTNLDVYFGAPENATITNPTPWLTNDSEAKEMLNPTVVVKLSGDNLRKVADSKTATINLTATLTITGNDAYNTAKTYNLISEPNKLVLTEQITATSTSNDETVSFTFEFDWGTYFGGEGATVNPYVYFNDGFENSSATDNLVLPSDDNQNEIVPDGTPLTDAGDYAAFVLGLIEEIGSVDISVTIAATVAA